MSRSALCSRPFRNFFRAALTLLGMAALAAGAQEPGVRHIAINELAPASQADHAVELYNYGPDQSMSGWTLIFKTSANGSPITYSFPAAFTLARHALVVVHFGPGTDNATDLYFGG